ncbi:antibiotic biosynthesis monooxygenase [Mycobacterium hodleri]|uniref:Antibiotic biosynthesis monooxygenase n=2 Tax=Mycolicibacterium hodleri TaxID=49897 RepID=A0A502E8W8_9MYCO|nr:antibiotic biosynthesis monooxygenase [Mycolicibacterium hodleri]
MSTMPGTAPITVINVFAVAAEHAENFQRMWTQCLEILRTATGFVDSHLHSSLDPTVRFRFVNVAHWDTEAHWHFAVNLPELVALIATVPYEQNPASYGVAAGWPPPNS